MLSLWDGRWRTHGSALQELTVLSRSSINSCWISDLSLRGHVGKIKLRETNKHQARQSQTRDNPGESDSAPWPYHCTSFCFCSVLTALPLCESDIDLKFEASHVHAEKVLLWILPHDVSLLQGVAYWRILLPIIECSLLFCYGKAAAVFQQKQNPAQEEF